MTLRFPKFCATLSVTVLGISFAQGQTESPSAKIDAFIEAGYKTHNVKPNEPIGDELFCRRVYLDIVGRIPSREEAKEFALDASPGKRAKLIDKLIDSEGFSSHFYNYWADILRVQTDMRDGAGEAYAHWVKGAIQKNMPYDTFVGELVGAKGRVWDNGAVGYYLRDAGMPLDNMSNTAQIFLGTRVVCAQCHNHPFDKWKQKDYYDMAAFTYGVKTELDLGDILPKAKKGKSKENLEDQELRAAIQDILMPLRAGVTEGASNLELPKDYKGGEEGYEGMAGDKIGKAKTLFGADRIDKPGVTVALADKKSGDNNNRSALINWMCDKENPRFTMVIANRLWKKTMGVGLVEPVDDFKDDTVSTNQPLMKYLCELMSREKYNQRSFLKHLYKTRTYQRAATTQEISTDVPYYYPGPIVRRMTAEQMWDSLVTLMIPNPDYRRKSSEDMNRRLKAQKEAADELEAKYITNPTGTKNLIAMAKAGLEARKAIEPKLSAKREELEKARVAKDEKKATELRKEVQDLQKQADLAMYKAQGVAEDKATEADARNTFFKPREKADSMMGGNTMEDKNAPADPKSSLISSSDWQDYSPDYMRASELPSPAPENHFLRIFGQSDRNVIENSWIDASVTQALTLMNGPLFDELTSGKSMLAKALNDAITPTERANLLWGICLGRSPNEKEKAIVAEVYQKTPQSRRADAWKEIFWSILNGREFIFVQ
jgi:hypothetical protein